MSQCRSRFVAALCAAVALAIVAIGLLTIVDAGWRDPYADQWRMYPYYLELPFPDSVLQLENGHRPILPGLVRVAELTWFGGSQTLQLTVGALAALLTVGLLAWIAWTDRSLAPGRQWLAVAAIAATVFWLGNGRFLLHGNESVHGYLLTGFLATSLALLLARWPRRRPAFEGARERSLAPAAAFEASAGDARTARADPGWMHAGAEVTQTRRLRVVAACLCAAAASFCFGPGVAAFAAVALVLLFERTAAGRVPLSALALLGLVLVVTVLAYLVLPDAGGVRSVLHLEPWSNLRIAATWLASMWVHLLQPLHDPDAARALPIWLSAATAPLAQGWQAVFGPVWLRQGPATVLGLAAIAYIVVATLISLRSPQTAGSLRRCGLALAWFAMGVAGLVALSRLDYFSAHPDQVLAQRYLPWSCLFWLGVLLTALTTPSRRGWLRALPIPVIVALLVAVLVSTPAYRAWGQRVQDGLALQAAGIAVGTLAQSQPLWETRLDEIERVRPVLARQRKAMFAWPELQRVHEETPGPPCEPCAPGECAAALTLESEPIDNRFGGTALALTAHASEAASNTLSARRVLVVDASGRGLGVLVRQRARGSLRYAGYAWPDVSAEALASGRLLALRENHALCLERRHAAP